MLTLASGSPRRRLVLTRLGYDFVWRSPDVDETPLPAEPADAMVERLARAKAAAIADAGGVRLAIDTAVVSGGQILGKPRDAEDAVSILVALGGSTHQVVSGYAVVGASDRRSGTATTAVTMRSITPNEAVAYVATGEPMDKAGAYGLQGFGSRFVTHIDGPADNVIGFPIGEVVSTLERFGVWPTRDAVDPLPGLRLGTMRS